MPPNREDEIRANLAEAQLVIDSLRFAGLDIDTVDDLIFRFTGDDLLPYMSILEDWWRRASRYAVKGTLVRSFIPYGKHMVPELLAEFRRDPNMDSSYSSHISVVLHSLAQRKYRSDMLQILRDVSTPMVNRTAMLYPLQKFVGPDLLPDYEGLLANPELLRFSGETMEVLDGLGRTRSPEALPLARQFLRHENSGVREHARRAVRRLERDIAGKAAE